ncbi:Cytochrome b-c1 complex subunit 2, mitochondrial [Fulvia fulva]|uniref:Cytochrome b-c1 complex subunit 2, mitochondrial n=1 Tax=Passalora fulva TaxID=5499 RepID=A0A9Q8P609_PASFU|nr:Cytochrome b-c1 complex subunit 2, mitochondrial [Fulvia fulva]KAK4630975.1 Cytochrome b-c1 complex subunit 2, mitochondrial [Fulvia fulva]KAK4633052.1 Cytochrome b-c1 complex subunit 2, mitochondrial [Fulvia fulva]UJO14504.1 Cytochrome b-c1 complex subunit 2, mitochondrial [Fulvia fulva]WPV11585.1 Cytochrome b-c1 complex subunit 2, mitochondrial [Fulvia fulva]WPV26685.1 Cytochrome b-c1 complex subunit 2, mitochondrial [Fulvia fulva]
MIARSAISRQAQRAARQSWQQSRNYAAATGSLAYQTGDANGIKVASRDQPGAVSTLALVTKAGTRYEPVPGLAEALQRYAFKSTERRSTLRIQRESELLGSELLRNHTRENLIVGAKFLRDDLPYFVELLAEVVSMTKYQQHIVNEEVIPVMQLNSKHHIGNTLSLATDSAHGLAFHRGLGMAEKPTSSVFSKYVTADALTEYAGAAYAKPNFAIVGNGIEQSALTKWVGEFFTDVSEQSTYEIKSEQSKYYGGEERIAHGSGNSMVLAFPGSSSATGSFYKPEVAVLAALLGGETSIKWAPGFSLLAKAAAETPLLHISTKSLTYTDAGLLTIGLNGTASDIRATAPKVVEALKGAAQTISEEDFNKAKALAKFKELEFASGTQAAIEYTGAGLVRDGKPYQINEVASSLDGVTLDKVKQVAKEGLENKASVSTVGDLYQLPYAEEIGLKV